MVKSSKVKYFQKPGLCRRFCDLITRNYQVEAALALYRTISQRADLKSCAQSPRELPLEPIKKDG